MYACVYVCMCLYVLCLPSLFVFISNHVFLHKCCFVSKACFAVVTDKLFVYQGNVYIYHRKYFYQTRSEMKLMHLDDTNYCINALEVLSSEAFTRRNAYTDTDAEKSAMHSQRCGQSQNRFLQKETKVLPKISHA